jgi:hypothetical protein
VGQGGAHGATFRVLCRHTTDNPWLAGTSPLIRLADAIQGHAGRSVASTYRHFDLKTLARGVAAHPVPGETPSHQIHDDRSHDLVVGCGAMG